MLLPDYDAGLRSASLIPNAKWRKRGLVSVFFGGSAVWTAWAGPRPLTPTGGPKPVGSKFGKSTGFGTTSGTGTTDRLDGGVLPRPSSGWRSIVSHYYANSYGGGNLGRIFQDASGSGLQAGEGLYCNNGTILYGLYASTAFGGWYSPASSLVTGRWQSAGVTHDQRTVNVLPTIYLDGAAVTVQTSQNASGSYQTTPCNMVWGNRASDGARGWDGLLGPTLIFDNSNGLSADEHAALDKDPLQVFTPDEISIWVPFDVGGGSLAAAASGGAIAGGSATLSANFGLAAVGVSIASGAGALVATVPLSAAGLDIASGAASVTAAVSISAAGLVQAAGTAGLNVAAALAAAGYDVASGSATLSGGAPGAISAAGGAVASGSALLYVTVQLAATGGDVAGGSATLSGGAPGAIAASGAAIATGSANLRTTVALTAAGLAQAIGAGQLVVHVDLSAAGAAQAEGSASFSGGEFDIPADWMLDLLYDAGPFGVAQQAITSGKTFVALLDTEDELSFDAPLVTTHRLRYRAGVLLATGATVNVDAVTYKVIDTPKQINNGEMRAALVRVA